jgi:hypothetical protein
MPCRDQGFRTGETGERREDFSVAQTPRRLLQQDLQAFVWQILSDTAELRGSQPRLRDGTT